MDKVAVIIEDDVNSARILAHLLAKENIDSISVTNFKQLQAHGIINPDIVFIDLEMPQMNGYEILSELLKDIQYQSIPIIASSVHTGELRNVQEAGFHGFISKPLSKDKFPKQLRDILDGAAIWDIS
jgi:CheY-like chemotaxis protein